MTLLLAWNFDEASGATVLDRSGNGRDLTISGIGVRTASGNGHTDRGLTAVGGGQQVGPSLTGLQTPERTIMCWLKNTSTVIGHVLEFYVGSLDSSAWSILLLSGQIHIQARNSSGFVRASAAWTPSSTWHHIAGTYDGTNVRLYIDGVLAATTALSPPLRTDATEFRVLDNSDSVTTIDDPRLYNVALSQAQIAADMAAPVTDAPPPNQGTLAGSFSSPVASFAGASVPADAGTLSGSFSSPILAATANGKADGLLSGQFSSPAVTADVTATAEVTLDGTFAVPVTVFDVRGSSNAELDAQLSGPVAAFVGIARASALLAGSFSSPSFTAVGGTPASDRDILVTIEPGTRPGSSIAVGPPRTIVAQGATQRSQIGAGLMDTTWRNGSKQFIDFTVKLTDPDSELTLSEVEAIPFWVAVTTSTETPARESDVWVEVNPEVTAEEASFAAAVLYLYEATAKGLHSVWVKFGPTPEEPIYQAATFVVL